jgi:hypothetical protein
LTWPARSPNELGIVGEAHNPSLLLLLLLPLLITCVPIYKELTPSVHFHFILSCTNMSSTARSWSTNEGFVPPPHLSEWKMSSKVFAVKEDDTTYNILQHYSSELSTKLIVVGENGTAHVIRPEEPLEEPIEPLANATNHGAGRSVARTLHTSGRLIGAPLRVPPAQSAKRKPRKIGPISAKLKAKIDALKEQD